jgi:ParB family chromosome partitioning protein
MSNKSSFPTLRGIDALFGEAPSENSTSEVAISQIQLPTRQPRRYFDDCGLKHLIHSIRTHGVLQPLIVRPLNGHYELVAGERRYRAAQQAGFIKVPVIIKELTQREAWQLALVENLQREDLNPIEETEGIIELLSLFLERDRSLIFSLLYQMKNQREKVRDNVIPNPDTQIVKDLLDKLGKDWYSFVCNRLSLVNLPIDILNTLREGKIEYTKAKAIARLKDEEQRTELLSEAIAQELSLSQIKERISELSSQEADTGLPLPQKSITDISSKLRRAQLWKKDPKKWRKAQNLLKKLEELLDEGLDEIGDG